MKYLLLILSLLFALKAQHENSASGNGFIVCDQPYALCTTAPCVPVPGSPTNASVCSCVVQDGHSLGTKTCAARSLTRNAQGQQLLTSNFGFKNAAVNRVMTCTGNNIPWTNCLDMPCIVDPQNSNQAACECTIVYSDSFVTYGGQCNTDSCSVILWSGASLPNYQSGSSFLEMALGLSHSPVQSCPS